MASIFHCFAKEPAITQFKQLPCPAEGLQDFVDVLSIFPKRFGEDYQVFDIQQARLAWVRGRGIANAEGNSLVLKIASERLECPSSGDFIHGQGSTRNSSGS